MNIVLVGYRGSGKSTVAKILSSRLKWPVYTMDQEIVEEAGMSIPQIVEKHGWEFFRDLESKIAHRASTKDHTIIDAGGGVVVRSTNITLLRQNSVLIWLKASPEILAERIRDNTERPSLTGSKSFIEEIEEVLCERAPKYQEAADHAIEAGHLSPETVADKILDLLRGRL
jgi:shikimate kinase